MKPVRRTIAFGIALLVGAVGAIVPTVAAQAAAPTVTVLGPNVDVRPGLATPAGQTGASISLARNEFESFQLAIEPSTTISNLTLDLQSAPTLAGAPGTTLATTNFTFYREGYYNVLAGPSLDTRSDAESSAGQWPDVLIPQTDYIYGQDRAAFHASVSSGGRAVVWVDVFAPAGQAPGTYSGVVRVKDGATVIATVPLTADVRSFGLPSTSSLPNLYLTNYGNECTAHTGHFACNWDDVRAYELQALYARVALENRVTISNPWPHGSNQTLTSNSYGTNETANFQRFILPLIEGTATDPVVGSQLRLQGAELTTISLLGPSAGESISTACGTACVNAWKARATADGFLDKLIYYTCDEPFLNAPRWADCRTTHTDVSGPSGLPELVTGPIQQAKDPALGNGSDGWIDVMVPLTSQMANKPGSNYHAGNQRAAYDNWVGNSADGVTNRLWIYTACDQAGCNGPSSSDQDPPWNSSYWNGWGGYAIDQPASQARALSWTAFEYDAPGELYWHTTQKLDEAWAPCTQIGAQSQSGDCLYDSGTNGDGTFFYPGKGCPVSGAAPACIGGTEDIPLESIRLKRIRDGREDYEYLNILATDGIAADDTFAHDTALGLFGPDLDHATFSTTVSQGQIDAARTALADRIDTTVSQLTVSKEGTGSGTVTSSPAGIDCGATCTASFATGTGVVLTATPAGGSTFTGWSGAECSGTGTCNVTMDSAKSVAATFTASVSATTSLSITAPRSVRKGSRATVKGALSSTDPSCEDAEPVLLKKGTSTIGPKLTDGAGAYKFVTRISRRTVVRVTYAGNASCLPSMSVRRTINIT